MDEEPDPISLGVCGVGQPPLGLKRKAETPLGSPPEPGQVLQQQDDDARGGRYKIKVKDLRSCLYITHTASTKSFLPTFWYFISWLSFSPTLYNYTSDAQVIFIVVLAIVIAVEHHGR